MYYLLITELSVLPAACVNCFIFCLEQSENNFLKNIDIYFVKLTECVLSEGVILHYSRCCCFHWGIFEVSWLVVARLHFHTYELNQGTT
jgi:hypothetical protein